MSMPPRGHPAHPEMQAIYGYAYSSPPSSSYVPPPAGPPVQVSPNYEPATHADGWALATIAHLAPSQLTLVRTDGGEYLVVGADGRSRCLVAVNGSDWAMETNWGTLHLAEWTGEIQALIEKLGGRLEANAVVPASPSSQKSSAGKATGHRRWFGLRR